MDLFRRADGSKISFDIVGLKPAELSRMKENIEQCGGKVEENGKQLVKFTHRFKYVTEAFPSSNLYSVQFIKDCIENNEIISPYPYRIGKPMMYDDHIINHLLYGSLRCCAPIPIVEIDSSDSESPSSSTNTREENLRTERSNRRTNRRTEESNNSEPEIFHTSGPMNGTQQNGTNRLKRRNNRRARESSNSQRGRETNSSNGRPETSQQSNRQSSGEGTENWETYWKWLDYIIGVIHKKREKIDSERLRGRGKKISASEEKLMITYLRINRIDPSDLFSLRVWTEIINDDICTNRTPGSLYKHFHYILLPQLEELILNRRIRRRFRAREENS